MTLARRCVAVIVAALGLATIARGGTEAFRWQLPAGFPVPSVPAENPMNEAKVALGAKLFADSRLSVTGQHSCQSCHAPERAFTDGFARSRGATGAVLPLNAPTLLNVAYNASLGWRDANVRTLEQQMRAPLFNEHPHELGLAGRESLVERELLADPAMAREFGAAFPGEVQPVSMDNVIRAIAAYERTLFAGHSAFDRYVFGGDHRALSKRQKAGMELFYSARTGCAGCHGGVNFAGAWVDRDNPQAESVFADTGTGVAVRVPTLRNLPATAPYLHDGRFAALDEVLDHYERLAVNPATDPRLRRTPLTTSERESLREFLLSLADSP
ncbi:MAG TPA: cytochrome c peroxidase [Steroidobacteraceae bacterium]|nr:cytochrome c peroxidase [Steroidobacteraceae bacterium]